LFAFADDVYDVAVMLCVCVLLVPPPVVTSVVLSSASGTSSSGSGLIASITGSNLGTSVSDVSSLTYSNQAAGIFNSPCTNIVFVSSSSITCSVGADVTSANSAGVTFSVSIKNVQSPPSPTATLATLRNTS
jgi:hypothetical protein